MTIRHPARWLIGFLVLSAMASWLVGLAFDATTLARAGLVLGAAGALTSLFAQAHHRGASPSPFTVLATLAAAVVGGWLLGLPDIGWWLRLLLSGVVVLPVMSLANAAYRADVRKAQRQREADAAALVRAVAAGTAVEPFVLYLRPFVSTDRLMAQALPSEITVSGDVPVYLDAETLLARSLRGVVPLIGLGRVGEMDEGVARVVSSDDDWRATVRALAGHALFIVMVPLSRPSTMWELKWLAESGLVAKVLFLMPEAPNEAPSGVWTRTEQGDRVFDAGLRQFNAETHMLDLPREWQEATREAAEFGLAFPPWAAVGALFTIDPATGAVRDILPLALSTLLRPVRYLRGCAIRLGLLNATERFPSDVQALFEWAVLLGGSTLEYALVRAADGLIVWRQAPLATRILQRSFDEGRPKASFVRQYLNELPALIEQRRAFGDRLAAARYASFARGLRDDPQLGSLVPGEAAMAIDEAADRTDSAA